MNALYEKRLYLSTDLKHFLPWLEEYLAERRRSVAPEIEHGGSISPEHLVGLGSPVVSPTLYGPGPVWICERGSRLTRQEVQEVWPPTSSYSHQSELPRIILRLLAVAPMRLEVAIQCHHAWAYIVKECEQPYRRKVDEIAAGIVEIFSEGPPEASTDEATWEQPKRRAGGRPRLEHDELVYRLAMAELTEEIKAEDRSMTFKEIARKICWKCGSNEAGVALLLDARHRLHRLQNTDPDGLLDEVAQFRADLDAKETRNT